MGKIKQEYLHNIEKLFKEYYFGNLDPYRYTIQNDVDAKINPQIPGEDNLLAVQKPIAQCKDPNKDWFAEADEYWKYTYEPVYE